MLVPYIQYRRTASSKLEKITKTLMGCSLGYTENLPFIMKQWLDLFKDYFRKKCGKALMF